jgi:hypothetical protein
MNKLSQNYKTIKQLIIILLAFILTFPLITTQGVSAQSDSLENDYAWDYDGKRWVWNLSIPRDLYEAYKTVPVSTRIRNGPAGYGFLTTTEDYYIRTLAQQLKETAETQQYNEYDEASLILAFVQSLNYISDKVTTGYDEYPRFPIETLVDGGDCEDSAILFATLLLIIGYDAVYINPPNHYAVGIFAENITGTHFTYNNKTYYYCETTGSGFKIGDLPNEFRNAEFSIYPIKADKQFIPEISSPFINPTPSPTYSTSTPDPSQFITPFPIIDTPAPTIQPILPLSFNIITESLGLFFLITLTIIFCIILATRFQNKSRELKVDQINLQKNCSSGSIKNRFCICCGTGNRTYAPFCKKCGKHMDNANFIQSSN